MAVPEPDHNPADRPAGEPEERVADSLRAAVERTLAASAAPAVETRQRAQELLDEVVRRGRSARQEASRRGEAARDEVVRRGEQAGERLADVIAELRPADRDAIDAIGERLVALERRLGGLERLLRDNKAEPKPRVEPEEGTSEPHSSAG